MNQFWTMLTHQLRFEFRQKERFVALALFATNILLFFYFAVAGGNDAMRIPLFCAEVALTAFFSMQVAFARIFEPEEEDRAFDLLSVSSLSPVSWFLAKVTAANVLGILVVAPATVLAAYFTEDDPTRYLHFETFLIVLLSLHALSSIGVLLSTLLLRANARQILHPLLYFPLTVPVLLCAVQALLAHLERGITLEVLMSSWLGLLIVFDAVYFAMGMLFYGELLKSG